MEWPHAPGQSQLVFCRFAGRQSHDRHDRAVFGNRLSRISFGGGADDEFGPDFFSQILGDVADGFGFAVLDFQIGLDSFVFLHFHSFHFPGDFGHDLNRLQRIFAGGGFAGKHDRVRAVQNRVGHVGDFGARRQRKADHGVKHLGGHDHRFGFLDAAADDFFLNQGQIFQWHFQPQIAARHHDAVGHF